MGKVGALLSTVKKFAGAHPVAAGIGGAAMGAEALHLGSPAARALMNPDSDGDDVANRMFELEQNLRFKRRSAQLEQRRTRQNTEQNLRQLALYQPDVYNRVLLGRPVPRGAVVLGGRQSHDSLMELAQAMGQGPLEA